MRLRGLIAAGAATGVFAATLAMAPGLTTAVAAPTTVRSAAIAVEETPEPFQTYTVDPVNDPAGARRAYAEMMATPSVDNDYSPKTYPPINGFGSACPKRRCRDVAIPTPPGVKVSGRMVRVLLPRGYHKAKNRTKRYPVVYLFNGALSPYDTWTTKTELVKMSRSMQAIFISPEGGVQPLPGAFSNWYDDTYDWESFHVDVVIPWVDRNFRTMRHGRALVGPSLGSLGALNYPAHNPGMFAAALSISGIVDTNMLRGNTVDEDLATAVGLAPPDFRRVWGDPVLNNANWDFHNPTMNVDVFKDVDLFVTSGTGYLTGDTDAANAVHTGYYEWLIWQGHRSFLGALVTAGIPFEARIREGGIHNWPYFAEPIRWGLPKIIESAVRSEQQWRRELANHPRSDAQ